MNHKRKLIIIWTITFTPLLALAEADEPTQGGSTMLLSVLYSVLPLIGIGVLLWLFYKFAWGKQQQRSENYIANQAKHNERMEQLLERIANALEKKD